MRFFSFTSLRLLLAVTASWGYFPLTCNFVLSFSIWLNLIRSYCYCITIGKIDGDSGNGKRQWVGKDYFICSWRGKQSVLFNMGGKHKPKFSYQVGRQMPSTVVIRKV